MAAVEVQHIGLEAGHFQTNAVILALLRKFFLVCFVDDLIRAVTGLLQQLVGITDNIITAQICAMQDLLRLLVCLADDILAHPLRVDERALEHIAVRLIVLHLFVETLVLRRQIRDLLAKFLRQRIVLLELLFDSVQEAVHIFGAIAAEVFFKLNAAHVLRGQHSSFLLLSFILKKLDD